jgi:branched-chain amino acid transport system ATP-binding protein
MLEVHDLQAGYGSGVVLHDLRLSIRRGEIVALMGRNGMGKSTMLKAIIGLLPARSGTINFNGRDITNLPAHEKAQRGIGYVPEGRRMFPGLTVDEHLIATSRPGAFSPMQIYRLFPQLRDRRTQSAKTLSGGEQQMLAIGRALTTNPRLLLLDEATEGLAPLIRKEIWAVISTLKDMGIAVLLVDKSVEELRYIADRFLVLEKGRIAYEADRTQVLLQPDRLDKYLHI